MFSANGAETAFAIAPEQRVAGFVAANAGDERLFVKSDDTAIAALLVADDNTASPFIARLTELEGRPSGNAEATGRYVGVIGGEGDTLFEVNGDVAIAADFESGSLSGEITNRIGYLDGLPFAFTLNTRIDLEMGVIGSNGRFAGTATLVEDGIAGDSGRYEGATVGPDGDNFIGQLQIETTTADTVDEDITSVETGVFFTE